MFTGPILAPFFALLSLKIWSFDIFNIIYHTVHWTMEFFPVPEHRDTLCTCYVYHAKMYFLLRPKHLSSCDFVYDTGTQYSFPNPLQETLGGQIRT
jgi:hypothetical protein